MTTMSNAERSSTTRATLLDATIQAIVTHGYGGATSARIAEISGLTRGAQLHHFKTKAGLVVEALLHLHARRIELSHELGNVSGEKSLDQVIEDIWSSFDDDLWIAAAELWTAARTDAELRTALISAEHTIGQRIRDELTETFAREGIPARRINAVLGLVLSAMRGMALLESFDPDPKRAKAQRRELVRALRALSADAAGQSTADEK